jgi:hypothetical protein
MPEIENRVELKPFKCGSCGREFAVVHKKEGRWYIHDDETMDSCGCIMFCPWCSRGVLL